MHNFFNTGRLTSIIKREISVLQHTWNMLGLILQNLTSLTRHTLQRNQPLTISLEFAAVFTLYFIRKHPLRPDQQTRGCSLPVNWWGMQTWTGIAPGSWAPFAYRRSTHFSEHRHLCCAGIQGENLHPSWIHYVLHNVCSEKQLKHFMAAGRKKSPRVWAFWRI